MRCDCGAGFITVEGAQRHHARAPLYCRKPKKPGRKPQGPDGLPAVRKSRAKAKAQA